MSAGSGAAVFAYGSLVDPRSAARTLSREAPASARATLTGWRRGFTQARDNRACEKTFALDADGSLPAFVLGLNVRRTGDPADRVNGVLIPLTQAELSRLDERELRYDRVGIDPGDLHAEGGLDPAPACVYVAKPEHLALEPPPGSVILRSYVDAVDAAFAELGPAELRAYRDSVLPLPAEVVSAHLVANAISPGNPREW